MWSVCVGVFVCVWVRLCVCVCHAYEGVMSHVCMCHVTHMKASSRKDGWVMSYIMDESCHTLWMSHVTHVNAKKQIWSVMSHIWMRKFARRQLGTGWRRLMGSPKLQIIFHKRATKYRSRLREMTYEDKGSYESSPPCMWICPAVYTYTYLTLTKCVTLCDMTHSYVARQIHLHKTYGVATISRLLKIIGLFCKRAL